MLRGTVKVIAVVLAATAIAGAGITAASAGPSSSASHRGAEHLTLMFTFMGTAEASVIATGLFTDGGTINLGSTGSSAVMKLGAGHIRLTTRQGSGGMKVNHATCLTTLSSRGTYKLSHGTGKYAGIRGSGHYTTTLRSVLRRKKSGACALNSRPLAQQGVATLSGSATLRN